MKPLLLASLALAVLAGCATTRLGDAQRLALYRQNAGAPVKDFQYYGSLSGWTPLGNTAMAVWTRPNQAYLLEFGGPCNDLDYAPAISLTQRLSRVSAKFDDVIVHGSRTAIRLPCRISSIRPLDVKTLRASEKELRQAQLQERQGPAP